MSDPTLRRRAGADAPAPAPAAGAGSTPQTRSGPQSRPDHFSEHPGGELCPSPLALLFGGAVFVFLCYWLFLDLIRAEWVRLYGKPFYF